MYKVYVKVDLLLLKKRNNTTKLFKKIKNSNCLFAKSISSEIAGTENIYYTVPIYLKFQNPRRRLDLNLS